MQDCDKLRQLLTCYMQNISVYALFSIIAIHSLHCIAGITIHHIICIIVHAYSSYMICNFAFDSSDIMHFILCIVHAKISLYAIYNLAYIISIYTSQSTLIPSQPQHIHLCILSNASHNLHLPSHPICIYMHHILCSEL